MQRYSQVNKYRIQVLCKEPLHTGSADGGAEEVLIHPVEDEPFLQASSLSGVFRAYYKQSFGAEYEKLMFGTPDDAVQKESRIRFTDGRFEMKTVKMELRPRVKINPVSGTVDAAEAKGTDQKSGQKFELEYVAAGAEMTFTVYVLDGTDADHQRFLQCMADIHAGNVQFGGQKSNGCGYFTVKEIRYSHFDLLKNADRMKWMKEDGTDSADAIRILPAKLPKASLPRAYDLKIYGKTEGELLVKSIAVTDCGKDAPDAMNIQNGKNEYIVPGSSLKGVIRNRMDMIRKYLNLDDNIVDAIFGKAAESGVGNKGIVYFYDAVVGSQEVNDLAEIRRRIHIDKFTGGVMNSALFSEKNVSGDVVFHASVDDNELADSACALMVLAFRDMAAGQVTIGSGYSVGKGFIHVKRIVITDRNGNECMLDFAQKKVKDPAGMLDACMKNLKRGGN